ncbi:MAG: RNA polymerase sigma factor [Lachnospiraceae bacterium]|nr:RNA polymerase sigma factor [Lachnospiraceae bacterium]
MEDNEILALLLARDEQGLKELEQKYGTRLKHLATGILPEEDAAECLNDTFLAVWNSIPPKQPEYLFAYTAKICRNLALNRVEWNQAAKRNAVLVELSTELEQCIPDTSATMEQQELGELISAFLKKLPQKKQQLFLRRYWYGESIKELAAAFGCRESKVKSILFRLRNQLWKELKKEGAI